jgi:hypothetical protein
MNDKAGIHVHCSPAYHTIEQCRLGKRCWQYGHADVTAKEKPPGVAPGDDVPELRALIEAARAGVSWVENAFNPVTANPVDTRRWRDAIILAERVLEGGT